VCVRVFIKPENDCEDDDNNNNIILEGGAMREMLVVRTVMCRGYRGVRERGAHNIILYTVTPTPPLTACSKSYIYIL